MCFCLSQALTAQRPWHLLQPCGWQPYPADRWLRHENKVQCHEECLGLKHDSYNAMLLILEKSLPDTLDFITTYSLSPRFWDLVSPERSYVVAGSTGSPSVSYYKKIIEGTEVVQVWWNFISSNICRHRNSFDQD